MCRSERNLASPGGGAKKIDKTYCKTPAPLTRFFFLKISNGFCLFLVLFVDFYSLDFGCLSQTHVFPLYFDGFCALLSCRATKSCPRVGGKF